MSSDISVSNVSLRFVDTQSTWDGATENDTFYLEIYEDGTICYSKISEEERRGYGVCFTSSRIDVEDIPDRVAAAMQQYADEDVIRWPTIYDPNQSDVERGTVQIAIEDESAYEFTIFHNKYIKVTNSSGPVYKNDIPQNILTTVDQYLPSDIEYLYTRA